jgi:hypothetical protein
LFDAYARVEATDRLAFVVHGDAGSEGNELGTSWWVAGALYARFKATDWLYLAARGERFHEKVASKGGVAAGSLFWPSDWVSSGTATFDLQPCAGLSIRLEYCHDRAEGPTYFRGGVEGDGGQTPFGANAHAQDALTLGATAWF